MSFYINRIAISCVLHLNFHSLILFRKNVSKLENRIFKKYYNYYGYIVSFQFQIISDLIFRKCYSLLKEPFSCLSQTKIQYKLSNEISLFFQIRASTKRIFWPLIYNVLSNQKFTHLCICIYDFARRKHCVQKQNI